MFGASCVVGPIAYSHSDIVTVGAFGSPVPAAPLPAAPAPAAPVLLGLPAAPPAPPPPIPAAPEGAPPAPAAPSLGPPAPDPQPAASMTTARPQIPHPSTLTRRRSLFIGPS